MNNHLRLHVAPHVRIHLITRVILIQVIDGLYPETFQGQNEYPNR